MYCASILLAPLTKLHNKDGSVPNPSLLQVCKEAHAGFLNSAITLKDRVFKQIDDLNRNNHMKHVLFTGHSAGGAVASLLCLSYQAYNSQIGKVPAPVVNSFIRK